MRVVRGKANSDRGTKTMTNNMGLTTNGFCLYQMGDVLCRCLDREGYM